jgi:hypothetical protein
VIASCWLAAGSSVSGLRIGNMGSTLQRRIDLRLMDIGEMTWFKRFLARGVLAALLGLALWGPSRAEEKAAGTSRTAEGQAIELKGKVVCLPEALHRLYQTELPTGHEHVYGFQTSDGSFYTLLRTKYSEALFADERVREKELILKGRVFLKSQILEVNLFRSMRHGVVCDLYYYCRICNIESVSPGPCACCQGTVELMEVPLRERREGK